MAEPAPQRVGLTKPSTDPEPVEAPLAPAARRGRLVISDGVVESIAQLAAREVRGTVSSPASGLTRRPIPRAQATVAGDRARVSVDINVEWPYPVVEVTRAVRETVTDRIRQLTGLHVDAADVSVAEVVPPSETIETRNLR